VRKSGAAVLKRSAFVFGAALALASAKTADATGGLDVWDPELPTPQPIPILPGNVDLPLRVLITSEPVAPRRADGRTFELAGKRYRGRPEVVALPDGRNGIVSTLSVDEYLYGVVPLEVAPGWPAAVLAAQAIVARTYAVARRSVGRPYDIVATSAGQAYGDCSVETPATNAAVDATSGRIIAYGGAAASVFYMACCGGHTEDAAEVWGRNPLPYLRGVSDPWCAGTPDYRWRSTIAVHDFVAALGADAAAIGSLRGVTIAEVDPSGRAKRLLVRGSARTVEVGLAEVRRALGSRRLPSTLLRGIVLDGESLIVEGAGRGHGVGLCQWGAHTMALQGYDPAAIVAFYFPGVAVVRD